jgi:tripeptidyl-peptidase-2
MSFGEQAAWSTEDKGQFIAQLRDEVIRKRDVIFVSSAGNAGPALSTVGAPAGTTTGAISVGELTIRSMIVRKAGGLKLFRKVPM